MRLEGGLRLCLPLLPSDGRMSELLILPLKSEAYWFLRIEPRRNLRRIVGKPDVITEFNHGVEQSAWLYARLGRKGCTRWCGNLVVDIWRLSAVIYRCLAGKRKELHYRTCLAPDQRSAYDSEAAAVSMDVCRTIPAEQRTFNLSFKHYREAILLTHHDVEAACGWLRKAEENNWSVSQLRKQIRLD